MRKLTKAQRERRSDRMDMTSLALSAASLGVGIAALCLNEKTTSGRDQMTTTYRSRNELTTDEQLARAKREKKEAAKGKRAAKASNKAEKDRQKALRVGQQQKIREYAKSIGYGGPLIMYNEREDRAWVAMEMNRRTGGDIQAVVCNTRSEAEERARAMKRAHRSGSQKSKDCIQGYARMDVSDSIDVPSAFADGCTRV